MAISAALVKELREKTSAGMMECKKALVETNGDLEAAIDHLRQAGLAKADKKADRIAAEGRIAVCQSDDCKRAAIVEVNCETDFVAKGDIFGNFADQVAKIALEANTTDLDAINQAKLNGETVDDTRRNLITTLGENINIRRVDLIELDVVNSYIHGGGKIGVIIGATCPDNLNDKAKELLRNLAMHTSAMSPSVIDYSELDLDFIEKETKAVQAETEIENEELARLGKPAKRIPEFISRRQISDTYLEEVKAKLCQELKDQGKPEAVWDKIIPGQIARYLRDNTQYDQKMALLSQTYVMNDKQTVEEAIQEVDSSIKVVKFTRFGLGEGIEKKVDNFVEEVMAQAKG